jgi:mono/diheme cytochrome c family protein
MSKALVVVTLAAGAVLAAWTGSSNDAAAQQSAALAGNAERGAPLFADAYNCYACHGFDAQSGEPRLVPLNYTQEGFITFVQNSPLPQMPAFPDAPAQDLADIYAYIRTIPADAPAVGELPLLQDILDRKARAAADSTARP